LDPAFYTLSDRVTGSVDNSDAVAAEREPARDEPQGSNLVW
jgi:hypothetical protein